MARPPLRPLTVRVSVRVRPQAKTARVEEVNDELLVAVTAPAREGRANEAVIAALARHFGVPRSAVRIVRGAASRRKIVEVERTTRPGKA